MCVMQITFPFFGDIMGFIGALGTGPTTFWLPSLMWLILKKPKTNDVRAPTYCPLSATRLASACLHDMMPSWAERV